MKITEESWARVVADVAFHEAVIVLLVKASPRREEIVSTVRQLGEATQADLLGSNLSDVQIGKFTAALERFLRLVGDSPAAGT